MRAETTDRSSPGRIGATICAMSVPLLVVSPHLDDAVLSCGRLLAANPGSVVVTVLAASPPDDRFVDWDRRGGFHPGDDVMAQRRREDGRALRRLRARPVWLEFRQDVYRDAPLDAAAIRRAVSGVIEEHDALLVALPLGLHHADHRAVADALHAGLPARRVRLYADQPYATDFADLVAPRVAEIPSLQPVDGPGHGRWRKTLAIGAYRSQLRALGVGVLHRAGSAPEAYWEVPVPKGTA